MGFVRTDVNYAAEYSRAMANAYPYLSYFGAIWASANSNLYKSGIGKTMYIPSITVKGAHAVDRDQITGTFNRNFNNEYQSVTLQQDREWDTLIDPMDIVETNDVATIANVTKVFNEMQKLPEQDAFLASKLAEFAGQFGGIDTASLTAANILEKWDNALEYMTNRRVNRDRVQAYMTPAVYKLLKQAAGITRFVDAGTGIRNIDRNVGKLDGVVITEVPADIMKTAFDFTEGWEIADGAAQIDFILVDPMAVAAPVKYEVAMMGAPTAQSKGKYLYYERYYYGAFCLAQRGAGVYAHVASAPSLGTLTVTSTAGTAAGATNIAVTGFGIGQDGQADDGLKIMYSANNASDSATLTYGAVPDAGVTWVEADAVPFALTSQTANRYLYVVIVNKQTGFVVAGGKTQELVGA